MKTLRGWSKQVTKTSHETTKIYRASKETLAPSTSTKEDTRSLTIVAATRTNPESLLPDSVANIIVEAEEAALEVNSL